MTPALMTRLDGGVLTLTMNRPDKRNALNPEMMQALLDALRDAAGNAAVKVLVLTGAGDAFCAGGDVGAMASGNLFAASYEASVDILRQKMEAPRLLHELGKPTIARVRGAAAGAGLSLALACDLRVADETAQFVTAFAKVGASGDYGGSWFLARLVGVAKAKELYFTSPRVGARETQEEAGLRVADLRELRPADRLTIRRPVAEGYMVERIEVFEAVVPAELEPRNEDGEVERFDCLATDLLLRRIADGGFTLEAALMLAASLERSGVHWPG